MNSTMYGDSLNAIPKLATRLDKLKSASDDLNARIGSQYDSF